MTSPNSTDGSSEAWEIVFEGYDPKDEGRRESVCGLGNGYLASRATAPDTSADDMHYPGTYRAGCYNRLVSHIQGQNVDDESLVNLPNWLPLTFRIGDGDWFSIDAVDILHYRQVLDLRRGLLVREMRVCDEQGRRTALREQRLVSMAQPHLMALRLELTPENWTDELEIRSALDGRVTNSMVKRDAPYNKLHLEPVVAEALKSEGIWLQTRTTQSRIEIALAARTRAMIDGVVPEMTREIDREIAHIAERMRFRVAEGASVVIEKIAALYTSRDPAIFESGDAAREAMGRAPDFAHLLTAHQQAWEQIWQQCDIEIEHPEYLCSVRLHMFQLLQTVSEHSIDLDVGLTSRGWHGEVYRGQVFWDELFVFPFLSFRFPQIARALLLYRYRRLDEARHLAQQHGYRGAQFPWRSASSGREETPRFQFNPSSGRWWQDETWRQHHINAAIAYNAWCYVQITGDDLFLHDYGAELLLEIARFWASIATYNRELDRFEIRGVVGPDEYHIADPHATTPGLANNTYTNIMAVWTLCRAREALDLLPPQCRAALWQKLELSEDEIDRWDAISRKMRVVFHEDGVLSQFEGFEHLPEFDLHQFRKQHGNEHVDVVLEAEGDNATNYQVLKQADVAVLTCLMSEDDMIALMARLGYQFDRAALKRTLDYYLQRTAHDSSLSRLVYAAAFAKLDPETSWQLFERALFSDMAVEERESTAEGIHLGATVGAVQALQSHYLGVAVKDDLLIVNPACPELFGRLSMGISYRRNDLHLEVTVAQLTVRAAPTNVANVPVVCGTRRAELKPGDSVDFELTE